MADPSRPYGLAEPTMADARVVVERINGSLDGVWTGMLQAAGLSGQENDRASFDRLLAVMMQGSGPMRLAAQALHVRATSYDHLAAALQITRSTS